MRKRKRPSIIFLRECLIIKRDGTLIWRKRPRRHFADERAYVVWNKHYAGTEAGAYDKDGYIVVRISFNGNYHTGKAIKAHHIAYALYTGRWPRDEVDHRNGVPDDNRRSNLRAAPRAVQPQNHKRYRNNTSGHIGVFYDDRPRRIKRWFSTIQVNGQKHYLGGFHTAKEANAAYLAAKKLLHHFQPVPRR